MKKNLKKCEKNVSPCFLKFRRFFSKKRQTPAPIFTRRGCNRGSTYTPFKSLILLVCSKLSTEIVSRPWVKLQAVKVGSSNRKSRFFGFAVYVQIRPKYVSNASKFYQHIEKTILQRFNKKNRYNVKKVKNMR